VNNLAAGTLLAILPMQAATIQRMPWVMDFDFLPDMGRMTMRLPSGARTTCSAAPKVAVGALR
jgi:hypothetical protein